MGMTTCARCPMAGVGDVPCAAVVTGHAPLCTSADPLMPEAVRRLSYELAGLEVPDAPPPEFPPLMEQAGNLAGAVVRFVASGGERRTPGQQAEIMAICRGCDRFSGGRCIECGCRLSYKIMMLSEKCPIGKW